LYLNPEFSIAMAANHFSIPSHHISFILNNHIKKSFPDIICEMRIDHSIQLLKDNSNKKYTMEAIGNFSGFNSRTTYYVSFKKITGISPNVYFQNLKLN
jgi:YesN/AraC family two-component response regulator